MEWLIALIFLIAVIIALLKKPIESITEFPYKCQPNLFSPAERSFYGVLSQAIKDDTTVFGKIRIADVVNVKTGLNRKNWQIAFNRIAKKHFDFVLCSKDDLSVLGVVELDDKSHNSKKQKERDRFIEGVCKASGIVLFRFDVRAGYKISEIRSVLYPKIIEDESKETLLGQQSTGFVGDNSKINHNCPQCSSPLVTKVAKRGKNKGSAFRACSAFPDCKYILKQDDSHTDSHINIVIK